MTYNILGKEKTDKKMKVDKELMRAIRGIRGKYGNDWNGAGKCPYGSRPLCLTKKKVCWQKPCSRYETFLRVNGFKLKTLKLED